MDALLDAVYSLITHHWVVALLSLTLFGVFALIMSGQR